jgi:hypothetical protein
MCHPAYTVFGPCLLSWHDILGVRLLTTALARERAAAQALPR